MPTATERDVRTTEEPPPWRFCTRVAFRFCFVYLGFCLTFAQITFAFAGALARWLPEHAVLWQMVLLDAVTRWVGRTVFGADAALNPDSGSGDQSSIWVLVFCLLLAALVATAVWSALDRHRLTYRRLAAWFLVFLRMCPRRSDAVPTEDGGAGQLRSRSTGRLPTGCVSPAVSKGDR